MYVHTHPTPCWAVAQPVSRAEQEPCASANATVQRSKSGRRWAARWAILHSFGSVSDACTRDRKNDRETQRSHASWAVKPILMVRVKPVNQAVLGKMAEAVDMIDGRRGGMWRLYIDALPAHLAFHTQRLTHALVF